MSVGERSEQKEWSKGGVVQVKRAVEGRELVKGASWKVEAGRQHNANRRGS